MKRFILSGLLLCAFCLSTLTVFAQDPSLEGIWEIKERTGHATPFKCSDFIVVKFGVNNERRTASLSKIEIDQNGQEKLWELESWIDIGITHTDASGDIDIVDRKHNQTVTDTEASRKTASVNFLGTATHEKTMYLKYSSELVYLNDFTAVPFGIFLPNLDDFECTYTRVVDQSDGKI